MSVVAQTAGKGDVTTTAKLPPPFTGYVKKTIHQDGSIDVQVYKDANLRNAYAYHGRMDRPEYQAPGQAYPVTVKLHVVTPDTRTDMTLTYQDSTGANAKIRATGVQGDGTVTKLDVSVRNGIANGTVSEEDRHRHTAQTTAITDKPIKDILRYLPSGGFRLSGIAAGSAAELHFDPALLSEKEREAWKRNQEIVAKETLPRNIPPTAMADPQRQQLVAAMEEALAAHRRCSDQLDACISRCQSSASSMSGSYISNVQACVPSCKCDALHKASQDASNRLNDYDQAQSRRQLEQAQQRSK